MVKKIPTLFEKEYKDSKLVGVTPSVLPEFEWVFEGEGVATTKFDGACCAVIDGEFYKRYDAKEGRTPPPGAIPCCEADPITGHWPHWVKVDWGSPADKWFVDAYIAYGSSAQVEDGTYEAIGRMFQGNPYNIGNNVLVKHGSVILHLPELSFNGIQRFLYENPIEGIVWWKDGEPQCKIKRTDFGIKWPLDSVRLWEYPDLYKASKTDYLYDGALDFLRSVKEIPVWDREPAISDNELERLICQCQSIHSDLISQIKG